MNQVVTAMDLEAEKVIKGLEENQQVYEQYLTPVMRESTFKDYYVKLFKGEITDIKEANEVFNNWIKNLGHPYNKMKIVDDSTGEVLFILPSILHTTMFDPLKASASGSFKDMVSIAANLNSSNPYRARNYLQNDLIKKFNDMRIKGHRLTEEQETWLRVLEKYDTKKEMNPLEQNKDLNTTNKLSQNLTEDDLI